jgi:hypothetical protein
MMPRPFFGMSSGFFFSFFALWISALVGSILNTRKRLSAVKLRDVCAGIVGWWHGRAVTTRRVPIDTRCDVARDDLAVAILRHVRIGYKLAVARYLLGQYRTPRVVVLMRERPLGCGRLRCSRTGGRGLGLLRKDSRGQQSKRANQRNTSLELHGLEPHGLPRQIVGLKKNADDKSKQISVIRVNPRGKDQSEEQRIQQPVR